MEKEERLVFWPFLIALGLPVLFWGWELRPLFAYAGSAGNDLSAHIGYVALFLKQLQTGTINLDAWVDTSAPGSPLFRVYQHWPHLLSAAIAYLTGLTPAEVVYRLTALSWMAQLPAIYLFARWLGAGRGQAIALVWLLPALQSEITLGHELRSYLLLGFGLFTQGIAFPWFLLLWALSHRLCGLSRPLALNGRSGLLLGIGGGALFQLHHYYGYIFGLIALTQLATGLIAGTVRRDRRTALAVAGATLGLALLMGYQGLSLLQDLPLQHRNLFFAPERWEGFGWGGTLSALLRSALWDSQRLPVIGILAAWGLYSWWRTFRAEERPIAVAMAMQTGLAVICLAGARGLGDWWGQLPGVSLINPERFVVIPQILGAGFASRGVVQAVQWARLPERERWQPGVVGIALLAAAALLVGDRTAYLRRHAQGLAFQSAIDAPALAPFLQALSTPARRGHLWTPYTDNYARNGYPRPQFGFAGYGLALGERGITRVSDPNNDASYGAEVSYFFDLRREADFHLLNVQYVILTAGATAPDFLRPRVTTDDAVLYEYAAAPGDWGLIQLEGVSIAAEEKQWHDRLFYWVRGLTAPPTQYPSIVPAAAARAFPAGVPAASGGDTPVLQGELRSPRGLQDGRAAVTAEIRSGSGWALLRAAYHPRWQFQRNGMPVAPVWAGPGQMAVPLVRGTNAITAEFTRDPVRHALFYVSLATLLGGGGLLVVSLSGEFGGRRTFRRLLKPFRHPANG